MMCHVVIGLDCFNMNNENLNNIQSPNSRSVACIVYCDNLFSGTNSCLDLKMKLRNVVAIFVWLIFITSQVMFKDWLLREERIGFSPRYR